MDEPKTTGLAPSLLEKATAALGGPKKPKHGMRSTHIDHHPDGSHTVRHAPISGDEVSYAVGNSKELQAKIKQYLGDAAEPEGIAEKNDSPAEDAAEKV